jgi:hypothetical protein
MAGARKEGVTLPIETWSLGQKLSLPLSMLEACHLAVEGLRVSRWHPKELSAGLSGPSLLLEGQSHQCLHLVVISITGLTLVAEI